jgi:transcriptional regulator with XRE-family HTH domain
VRALRRRRGWSQAVLAAKAGLSHKFLGEVERGEKSISLDNLAYLARALRVPMTELLE